MNNDELNIQLKPTADQAARLRALQVSFAEVCNVLAPLAQQTRCWNRVALHHLAYRSLREHFPEIGSQMICNAIYSVSRMSRIVYQHPASPWNIAKLGGRPLPLLRFTPDAPVYFDRHTLNLKGGRLSIYTLDGRMHFDLDLGAIAEARFRNEKLHEILLAGGKGGYRLSFSFSTLEDMALASKRGKSVDLPEYLIVQEIATPAEQADVVTA